MENKRNKAGLAFLFIIIIVAVIYILSTTPDPPTGGMPDMTKTIFMNLSGTDNNNTVMLSCILNSDNTGSITNPSENNYGEQGTWQINTQTSDMVKVIFTARGYNYLITLYGNEKKEAALAALGKQFLGYWYQ